MTTRQKVPYVFLLSLGGAMLCFLALDSWLNGLLIQMGSALLAGAALMTAAAVLALKMPGSWMPEWARRYELVAVGRPAGVVLRCNRCDTSVLPPGREITLPRVLTYAYTHLTLACEPRRATDPDDTRRLDPDRRRRLNRP